VCNVGGNVLGLMPHPEHVVDRLTGGEDGLKLFRSVQAGSGGAAWRDRRLV
jgi:phosphoribosylformylglycinamidine synthase